MITSHLNDAIAACEQALREGQNFGEACRSLGMMLQSSGRFEEAVVWQARSLQDPPNAVEIYAALGGLYAAQQLWSEAIAAYQTCLSLDPNYAEAYRSLGSIYASLEEPELEAINRFQAVKLQPSWATADNQFTLGNSLMAVGKVEEAIVCYQRAIELRPEMLEAHYDLGVAFNQLQQWPLAEAAFLQALQINPNHAPSHYGLGKLAEQQEQFPKALAAYGQAAQLDPESANIHYSLSGILIQLKDWQAALPVCQRAVELVPDQSWGHHNLGYVYLHNQQFAAAAESLQRAIALNPDFSWSHYHLGDACTKLERWEEAIAAYRRMIQLDAEFPWSYHNLVDLLLRLNRWDEAIATSTLLLSQGQRHPWIFSQLGRALVQKGDMHRAAACIQKACMLRGWVQCEQKGYQFTQDWFSHNIPILEQYLRPYIRQPNLQFLEIGSYQGMSTCWFLDQILSHETARLTCIDPDYQPEFAINLDRNGVNHNDTVGKLTQLTGRSDEILPTLDDAAYDVMYVDGCHWADYVRHEATLAWRLLKPGGLMIFDDYQWSDPNYPGQDTQIGIDAFLATVHDQFEVVHQGYQIIIQKLTA
ncbi:MAG: tetratricopeptide repeat protein [Oculatellaceae cyanobacterium Prado106]|nr:tetratricopeptide repeat protein [Oculatellaceae cyanobacterium Prado106]